MNDPSGEAADYGACRKKAMDLLAVRERCEEELRRRLVRADFSHLAIERTLGALKAEKLLDDRRFAEQFASERRENRGHAPARIEHELKRRGVDRETAHSAAWGPYEQADRDPDARMLGEAMEVLRGKVGRYRGLEALTVRRRMAGVLGRGGYPAGVAMDAVDAVLDEMRSRGLLAEGEDGSDIG
ncbi:MAG: regulatory protein RecX [bacterium]